MNKPLPFLLQQLPLLESLLVATARRLRRLAATSTTLHPSPAYRRLVTLLRHLLLLLHTHAIQSTWPAVLEYAKRAATRRLVKPSRRVAEISQLPNAHGHQTARDPATGLLLPAYEGADGSRHWCRDGKQHRDDRDPATGLLLPAYEAANGYREWYVDGKYLSPPNPKSE